jgi:hypothetical protein
MRQKIAMMTLRLLSKHRLSLSKNLNLKSLMKLLRLKKKKLMIKKKMILKALQPKPKMKLSMEQIFSPTSFPKQLKNSIRLVQLLKQWQIKSRNNLVIPIKRNKLEINIIISDLLNEFKII